MGPPRSRDSNEIAIGCATMRLIWGFLKLIPGFRTRYPGASQFATAAAMNKTSSDFSIARILAKEDKEKNLEEREVGDKLKWLRNLSKLDHQSSGNNLPQLEDNEEPLETNARIEKNRIIQQFKSEELSWLRCTRYCPPKIPRRSYAGKSIKRKPGSHPRIPFTKQQLDILENKYKTNAYLSRKDVVQLSDTLNLSQSRIKIWFQNRRARERRETLLLEQKHTTDTKL